MPTTAESAAQFWSNHTSQYSGRHAGIFWWEAGPEIASYMNRRVSGSPDTDWVSYTLKSYYEDKLPVTRCLSLGCGDGGLERRLAQSGFFQQCDAYDVAAVSLEVARRSAEAEGFKNIHYFLSDINELELPSEVYDAVWINGAMHHFDALEHVCRQVNRCLKPGGLLFLNEYVGPSRFQFPDRQKEIANLCLQLLPRKYRMVIQEQIESELRRSPLNKGARWFVSRLVDKLRDGDLMRTAFHRLRAYAKSGNGRQIEQTTVRFPSRRDVIASDPSEAVRSAEIVKVLQQDFEVIERKDLGGNVLQFLLSGIAGRFSNDDKRSQAVLRMAINIEDTLLQCGELQSDFAYLVARPRKNAH